MGITSGLVFHFLFQKATSESVDGKDLTMFSFEGVFKTRPNVSLGGASKKVSVISLLLGKIVGKYWVANY